MDKMKGTILPGGIVKIETDAISGPNHLSADKLVKGIEQLLGGETVITKNTNPVEHHHHEHDHVKGGL